jgi:hypothetical protein
MRCGKELPIAPAKQFWPLVGRAHDDLVARLLRVLIESPNGRHRFQHTFNKNCRFLSIRSDRNPFQRHGIRSSTFVIL